MLLELAGERGGRLVAVAQDDTARTTLPRSSSGAPTTAASATAAWDPSADSTSNGPIR